MKMIDGSSGSLDSSVCQQVEQALEGPDSPWRRRLLVASMPVWLGMMAYVIYALTFKLETESTY
jgi:hypothetical protein